MLMTLSNPHGSNVVLFWSTGMETDNEGFCILRSESANGHFTAITPSIIASMRGAGMKATYTFTDGNVEIGKSYYYRLQDIDSRGKVTTQRVVSVNTAVAGGERPSQEVFRQEQGGDSASLQAVRNGEKESIQEQVSKGAEPVVWESRATPLPIMPSMTCKESSGIEVYHLPLYKAVDEKRLLIYFKLSQKELALCQLLEKILPGS